MNAFEPLGVSAPILRSLADMRFDTPTPIQLQAIKPLLRGRDIIAKAPTGTGKTGAFGIPLLQKIDRDKRVTQALVLCPTRELAMQITDMLKALAGHLPGMRIAAIYGGQNIEKQFALLRKAPHVIVATPGRLLDHMARKTARLALINILVLDEADRMLDMGFRPDLNKIVAGVPDARQTMLFSATVSKEILSIAGAYMTNPVTVKTGRESAAVDTVTQFYTEVPQGKKRPALLRILKSGRYPLTLVFVNTKRMADRLSGQLASRGIRADSLHGNLSQNQRDRVMKRYRAGEFDVLVATDVAARGIDVHNIDAVINYDIPNDHDSYVHRIGRTGRASQTGVAYTFVYNDELDKLLAMEKNLRTTITRAEGIAATLE
ncbi:MAG: DEAD/DEAH box helicase [Clostridiales bacterium]|jgi:ATP-dependent RNA helicase DeaD|nr:DEAD/DEAH box helicase [Clostridiales bacterium]